MAIESKPDAEEPFSPQPSAPGPQPGLPLSIVDAFTDRPFRGNPAAVCVLDGAAEAGWMQLVAAEMNLSETAFVYPLQEAGGFSLRWFTPALEVELCGHATLATAHVLWEDGYLTHDQPAIFETLSGRLIARWAEGGIELDFPSRPVQPVDAPADLLAGVGVVPLVVMKDAFKYVVELASEQQVRELKPDMAALARMPEGVIVTCRSESPDFDFISRYFAPSRGVPEDPVTGSAHCSLAPYWSDKLGKQEFVAYQASARGGIVGVRIEGERVVLRGQAVTVLRGVLRE